MDREKFKQEAKQSIDKIFAKIDELEAKKERAKAGSVEEYDKVLANLKVKRDALVAQYDKLADISEEKWEEAKSAFSAASESFKEGFTIISSLFK